MRRARWSCGLVVDRGFDFSFLVVDGRTGVLKGIVVSVNNGWCWEIQ